MISEFYLLKKLSWGPGPKDLISSPQIILESRFCYAMVCQTLFLDPLSTCYTSDKYGFKMKYFTS